MKIPDIQNFANYIENLGIEYQYTPLTEWGKELYAQAERFDITALRKTLEQFSKIIEILRSFL